MQEKQCWEVVIAKLETELSKANFQTWFSGTHYIKNDNGEVYIGVPNDFAKDWIEGKYKTKILEYMRADFPSVKSITYTVKAFKKDFKTELEQKLSLVQRASQELPLEHREDGLNPKYTFKNFIIGDFNQLAFAASQAIIRSPGTVYNPLFIYGNTGLGKTHLIQAMGNSIRENHPGKRVLYTSLEKFYNDYVDSVQKNRQGYFKEKYRKYDVLIMDDIQFIVSKERTQDELFHLFNSLHHENKQIIFSSDKHPNFIIGLEDRLKSRFSSGMIIDVNHPDFESRMMILSEKTKHARNFLGTDVLSFIAEHITGNVRELEGIANLILCHTEIKKEPMSVPEVKQLIKNHIKEKVVKKPEEVIDTVAKYYNIPTANLTGKTRRQDVVYPRQIAIFLLREVYGKSYQIIGEKLGGRDHTTVMHSYEKIKVDKEQNPQINKEIEEIRQILA
jgi:chromosomal replication initiator protein